MTTILTIINLLVTVYSYILIGYIFLSWVPQARESVLGQALARLAEPYLGLFRRFIPPIGMIDISPIVALIALRLAWRGLVVLLVMISGWI
ncbi:YggT family protein [Mechercharimyces sp. CAU 1602]|uniref:YggT family protein n=1 Tax=Mechercharimyces sp. CAU 1602 TaxID=2973933 RepID=UPI0021620E6D|nr:YggT family protein [Mechercharimyces sp. CAU 1602]MCS1350637.1 YggT family protein [Mechercharimyces sp. CAU 1602]